jgi:hypothetical protein
MSRKSCRLCSATGRRDQRDREREDYSIRLEPAIVGKIAAHPANFAELLAIFARERLELAIVEHIIVSIVQA